MEIIEKSDIISSFKPILKKNNRDELFMKELNQLQFPEHIKIEAFNIYKLMKLNIKRKTNRIGLKFFCIYNAYRNYNQIKDPNQLCKSMGLDPSDLSRVFKLFSYQNTGYKMKEIEISPLNYISEYYENTGLRMEDIDGTLNFAKEILSKDQSLEDEYPQEIAAGIIMYYMVKIHGINPSDKFYEHLNRNETKMMRIMNKIGSVYNS